MLKKIALGLAVLVAALLVFGVIGELVVRVLYGRDTVMFPRYHTRAQYGEYVLRRIRPSSRFLHSSRDGSWEFVTNRQGFRDTRDFAYAKPPGAVRVLVLGDSHTQGYEAHQESTYSAVLERYLTHRGIRAEVLNTGVSGFGTAEELLFLENEGVRFQPDYVVLGFFANDYQDNVKTGLFGLDAQKGLVVLKKEHAPGVAAQDLIYAIPGVRWLGEHSHLYSLVFNNVWALFKTRLARDRGVELAVAEQRQLTTEEVELTRALLERMYAFCRARGVKLVLLDIPAIEDGRVVSSVTPALRPTVERNSDAYLDSAATLADLDGAVDIHVPHGHRHISELTHAALGVAIGKVVLRDAASGPRRVSSSAAP